MVYYSSHMQTLMLRFDAKPLYNLLSTIKTMNWLTNEEDMIKFTYVSTLNGVEILIYPSAKLTECILELRL